MGPSVFCGSFPGDFPNGHSAFGAVVFRRPQTLDDRIDELLSVWEERCAAGDPVTPEELCAACPDLLSELRWHIQALAAVDSHFGLIGDVRSTSDDRAAGLSDLDDHAGRAASRGAPEFQSGDRVDVTSHFRIECFHACGGLGSVYIAHDPVLNRRVAIKIPRRGRMTSERILRFEREARITGRLDHPGIIPVHAMNSDSSDRPFYVMRFVAGKTLQERIESLHADGRRRYPAGIFASIDFRLLLQNFVSVCNVVAYAHGQRVIHRDIKPAHILFGSFGEVLLLDWGLARVLDDGGDDSGQSEQAAVQQSSGLGTETPAGADLRNSPGPASGDSPTRTGQIMGTPAFASPEQLLGQTSEIDQRSDIYSLGATLFALLTGGFAMGRSGFNGYLDRLRCGDGVSAHEENPSVPAPLEAVCRRAMAIDPAKRYPEVTELIRDLERWLAGESVSVHRDSVLVRAERVIRRRPGAAAATAASVIVALVAGLIGAWVLSGRNEELRLSNRRLRSAMTESADASHQAMQTLRLLVDDVIVRKFSRQDELSDADRGFLNSVLTRFEAVAALQGDSIEQRTIRADCLQLSGQILRSLSQLAESMRNTELSVAAWQDLVSETGRREFRDALAQALCLLCGLQTESGEFDKAEKSAVRTIQLLSETDSVEGPQLSTDSRLALAEAHLHLAHIHESRHLLRQAVDENLEAVAILETLTSETEHVRLPTNLGTAFRSLGGLYDRLGDAAARDEFANRSLVLQRQILPGNPESHHDQLQLIWALYDHSYTAQARGDLRMAETELNEAAELATSLTEAFPLISDYRSARGSVLYRRGAIRRGENRFDDARRDLEEAVQLLESDLRREASFSTLVQLIRSHRQLASLYDTFGHSQQAEIIWRNALTILKTYQEQFPEVVVHDEMLPGISLDLASFLASRGQAGGARELLTDLQHALSSESPGAVHSRASDERTEILRLMTGVRMAEVHVLLKQQEMAANELSRAAALADSLAGRNAENPGILSSLVSQYGFIASISERLGDDDGRCRYHERQMDLLEAVVRADPRDAALRRQLLVAQLARADELLQRDEYSTAQESLNAVLRGAESAMADFPEDADLRTLVGGVHWSLGRALYGLSSFQPALDQFNRAVRLSPSSEDRAIRALCLAELRMPDAEQEIDLLVAEKPTNGPAIVELLTARSILISGSDQPEEWGPLISDARQLLTAVADAGRRLRPGTIQTLRTRRQLKALRDHAEIMELIRRVDPAATAN